jgi:hypothetical protein
MRPVGRFVSAVAKQVPKGVREGVKEASKNIVKEQGLSFLKGVGSRAPSPIFAPIGNVGTPTVYAASPIYTPIIQKMSFPARCRCAPEKVDEDPEFGEPIFICNECQPAEISSSSEESMSGGKRRTKSRRRTRKRRKTRRSK